ncbi:TIGR04104 family putative zinc finger protein [Planococcus versutus]|uniref:Cxxc_20_cxxc protein n=1 Tax=Planococcus versutus TaxID=1302659 RepID=A0A1B1S1J9_9BACL|nr:TIGR04104 family putative zinc finger protein [Planococcus versutus]ANU27029.1 hypothetical protein I858_008490 [Planococcus versutus]
MSTCENCGQKWTWRSIVWQTVKFKNNGTCPYCGATQYIVPKSTKLTRIVGYIPAFLIILLTLVLDLDGLGIILLAVTLMLVFLALYPFIIKLSNTDNMRNF